MSVLPRSQTARNALTHSLSSQVNSFHLNSGVGMFKKSVAALAMLALLAAAAAHFLRAGASPPTAASEAGAEEMQVRTEPVVRKISAETISAPAQIRSTETVAVTPKTPTRIRRVLVREGETVAAGAALVLLDTRDAAAAVSGADAGISAAEANLERARAGRTAKLVEMDSRVAEAEAGLKTAALRHQQAEAALELIRQSVTADIEKAAAGVTQAESAAAQARIAVQTYEDTAARLRRLLAKGGVPKVEVESVERQLETARSQLMAAEAGADMAKTGLKSARQSSTLRIRTAEQDVAAAEAGVRLAKQGVETARRARSAALSVAEKDIAAAKAQTAQASAGRLQAASAMDNGALTAPITGTVMGPVMHAGEMAQPGMPILTIAAARRSAEAMVPAADSLRLSAGSAATVRSSSSGRTYSAVVQSIAPGSSADGRGVVVTLSLPADCREPVGTSLTAEFRLKEAVRQLVPLAALRTDGVERYVFVVEGGRAVRQTVKIGATRGDYAELVFGIPDSRRVVVQAPISLAEGSAVRDVSGAGSR
jgi:RND family efflux transporter MFP subunit